MQEKELTHVIQWFAEPTSKFNRLILTDTSAAGKFTIAHCVNQQVATIQTKYSQLKYTSAGIFSLEESNSTDLVILISEWVSEEFLPSFVQFFMTNLKITNWNQVLCLFSSSIEDQMHIHFQPDFFIDYANSGNEFTIKSQDHFLTGNIAGILNYCVSQQLGGEA